MTCAREVQRINILSNLMWVLLFFATLNKKIIKNKPNLILIGRMRRQGQMHVGTDCSPLIKPSTISLPDSAKYFLAPGDNHALNLKLILGNWNS